MDIFEHPIVQQLKKQWELKKINIYTKKRDNRALISLIKATAFPSVRLAAITSLRELREPVSVPTFIEILQDKSVAIRRVAVKALGEIADSSATGFLIQMLEPERKLNEKGEENVIDDVLRALGRMKNEKAVEILVKLLWEKGKHSEHERGVAAACLGQIRFESAVPTLVELVKDETESDLVHKNAIWALREITGKDYEFALMESKEVGAIEQPSIPVPTPTPASCREKFIARERFIAIIDYGMGNLHSVQKAIEKVGYKAKISSNPQEIEVAQGVVLPGVGAFKDAMEQIKRLKLDLTIHQAVDSNKPFLGICLGMQLLFTKSFEDGTHNGLDIIKGEVKKLPPNVRVPHIGWNTITNQKGRDFSFLADIPAQPYLYFVHSYYVVPMDDTVVGTTTLYGVKFPSIIWQKNVYATQFHPEKSQDVGLKILKNFLKLTDDR